MHFVDYVAGTKGPWEKILCAGAGLAGLIGGLLLGQEIMNQVYSFVNAHPHTFLADAIPVINRYSSVVPVATAMAGAVATGGFGRVAGRGVDYFFWKGSPRNSRKQD